MNKNQAKLPIQRSVRRVKVRTSSAHGGCTLSEIASTLGIGRERVRQIEAKALIKMRKAMQEKGVKLEDLLNS
jgi:RNA polymerase sigma-32 factor